MLAIYQWHRCFLKTREKHGWSGYFADCWYTILFAFNACASLALFSSLIKPCCKCSTHTFCSSLLPRWSLWLSSYLIMLVSQVEMSPWASRVAAYARGESFGASTLVHTGVCLLHTFKGPVVHLYPGFPICIPTFTRLHPVMFDCCLKSQSLTHVPVFCYLLASHSFT